jgi:nitroreductase/dihydropteridine reductase
MTFLELMESRYTTKKYDGTKKISKIELNELKKIVRLSPSSLNSQPWKFTFVSDEKTKNQLADVSMHNREKILFCDSVVVFSRIENLKYFERLINSEMAQYQIDYYNNFIKVKPENEIKSWFSNQLYLSLGIFLSACASMNIDSTPMEGIEPEKYNEILGLKDFHTEFAVCIGYRDSEDKNQPHIKSKIRLPKEKVIASI